MANIIKFILLFDFAGFVLWSISGQVPADGFFIGAMTRNFISLII
tara:strand:- start:294 stop:428 length:135 start_codon:yes stop_codon:yes gene_type:complete